MSSLEPKPIEYNAAGEVAAPAVTVVESPPQRVTVVDFNISFDRLLALFVKGTLAALLVAAFFAVLGFMAFLLIGTAMR